MKLNKIEIIGFGKLENFTLELGDNFNVVFGENEFGKTTVMTFIKCMFYGTGNKKQNLRESIREKYTPWNGGTMGGRIFFESGGVNYCLEREFKGSDATDRVVLTNKDTGKALPANSKIGESLFSLTESAFIRSIFIDNAVSFSPDNAAKADFNSRLSSAAVSLGDDISAERVEKRILDAKHKLLSSSGRAGALVKDRENYRLLQEKIAASYEAQRKISEIAEDLQRVKTTAAETEGKIKAEKEFLENESAVLNAKKLEEYISCKQEVAELDKSLTALDGTLLPFAFTKTVSLGLANYNLQKSKAEDLENEIKQLKEKDEASGSFSASEAKAQAEELAAAEKDITAQRNDLQESLNLKQTELSGAEEKAKTASGKKVNLPLCILGVLLIILAIPLKIFVSVPFFFIVSAVLGVLFLVLSFVLRKDNSAAFEQNINTLKGEISKISQEISALDLKLNEIALKRARLEGAIQTDTALKNQRAGDLKQKEEQLAAAREKEEKAKLELISYFSKWKEISDIEDIEKENEILAKLYDKRKEKTAALNLYVKDLGDLELLEAKEKLEKVSGVNLSDTDFEAHRENLDALQKSFAEQNAEKARLETLLSTAFSGFVNPETLERELKELDSTIKSKEEFVAAADLALTALRESGESMRKNYGGVLEGKTQEIFKELTDGKYGAVSLDNNLEISAEEKGLFGAKSVDYLSRGTTDQAYLSLRLALASLLAGEEGLPVMLDDALSQYDDQRQTAAVKFLGEYSKTNQTVLFTCHGTVRDTAKEYGANIINAFE